MNKYETLEKLVNADGIPGHEQEVFQIMKDELIDYVDEIKKDNLGSFVSVKNGKTNRSILLASHMDEVGFIVKEIDNDGFIYLKNAGGWVSQVIIAQKMKITTKNGNKIIGVTGSKSPHIMSAEERKNSFDLETVFLDLGVSSKKEVEDLGVKIGDMITPFSNFEILNNQKYLLGKAFDNRIGCQVVIDVMKEIKEIDLDFTVYGVGNVQEEVGLRGAGPTANLVKPDLAIAIDTGIAGDIPQSNLEKADSKIGYGPQVTVIDGGTISHLGLRMKIDQVAQKNNIPYQPAFLTGGATDAGKIHISNSGVPSISISVATRYLHSHTSIIHADDYHNLVKLIVEFLKTLSEETFLDIKNEY